MPSSTHVRDRFRRQKTKDTAPELALRRELHRRGLRYRLHQRLLPDTRRTVDIVFRAPRIAVDVRGCWWHSCPDHGLAAKANADWWRQKLQRTVDRDRETEAALRAAGWRVLIVWEHEDPGDAAGRIEHLVRRHNG